MSIKSLRARAAAALRRSSSASATAGPLKKASVGSAESPQWRIESLEPKLLLSADALPAAHLLIAPAAEPVNPGLDGGASGSPAIVAAPASAPGPGNNLYLFGVGDGPTLVSSYADPNLGKVNTLQFKAGVLPADVTVARAADSQRGGNVAVALTIKGTTDTITFNSVLFSGTPTNPYNGLQRVQFADGTTWDMSQLLFLLGMGTADDDFALGSSGADLLNGADGFDYLDGQGGNDTLYGGRDDDELVGGAGDDILDGGTGDDILNAGTGSNTFVFGLGDGQDRLYLNDSGGDTSRINTLQFKAGIDPADIVVKRALDTYFGGNIALELSIKGTTDKVTVNGFFYGENPVNRYNGVQRVRFANGVEWDLNAIVGKLPSLITGTSGDDVLRGTSGDDTIDALGGNDTVYAAAGNDTVMGGDGNDVLYGEDGNDSLSGGDGNDTLDGGNGADILDGGAGNDTLNAGAGNNTFVFGRGDGQDRLYYNYDATAGRINTLQFKAGIVPADILLKQAYDNYFGGNNALELSIVGTTDKITVNAFFYSDNSANPYNGLQRVRFDDGTEWDIATILSMIYAGTAGDDNIRGSVGNDVITGLGGNDTLNGAAGDDIISGGDGNDVLYGEGGNDRLSGGDGNDTLDGGDGDDILDGGAGNDTLNAGAGNNTFVFGRGDGQDRLYYNYDATAGRINTLQFKAGIVPADILVKQAYDNYFGGNALELSIAGTADKVTVNGFFYGDNPANPYNGLQRPSLIIIYGYSILKGDSQAH